MRFALALTLMTMGAGASAQTDPLAPLPEAPARAAAPLVRPAAATTGLTGFSAYKQVLGQRARAAGVREATIQAVVPYLSLDQRAIRLDRAQPGQINNPNATPPFAPYRRRHVTSDLIRRGAAKYREHYSRLMQIEQRMGVPASIILGIYAAAGSPARG